MQFEREKDMKKSIATFLSLTLAAALALGLFSSSVFADAQEISAAADTGMETAQTGEEQAEEVFIEDPAAEEPAEVLIEEEASADTQIEEEVPEEQQITEEKSGSETLKDGNSDDGADETKKAKRTILMYLCGADLETDLGCASRNLRQILRSNFSSGDDVRFIVMTGGSKADPDYYTDPAAVPQSWKLESSYLCDGDGNTIDQISDEYNQIWEAKGLNAEENAGKLVLIDGDGITGPEGTPVLSKDELMTKPETLKAFLDYGAANFPAEKYDLILWDHGGGMTGGFGMDEHDPNRFTMYFHKMLNVLLDNGITDRDGDGVRESKFDIINFDACLMSCVETILPLADITDYLVVSPENEPASGQFYEGWLSLIGQDPDYESYGICKRLVDDYIDFYSTEGNEDYGMNATMTAFDMKKLTESGFADALNELAGTMRQEVSAGDELLFYDEMRSFRNTITYGDDAQFVDFGNLAQLIGIAAKESNPDASDKGDADANSVNRYTDTAKRILGIINDPEVMYKGGTEGVFRNAEYYRDEDGNLKIEGALRTGGMHIFFPTPKYAKYMNYDYYRLMEKIVDMMPQTGDGRREALISYMQAVVDYVIIDLVGQSVTKVISEGHPKEDVNLQTMREWYWDIEPYEEYGITGSSDWLTEILPHLELRDEDIEVSLEWLEGLIHQQAEEAMAMENVTAYKVSAANGTGYKVKIDKVKKRVIESVNANVIAEIPIRDAYLEQYPKIKDFVETNSIESVLKIGEMRGSEEYDFDYSETTDETYYSDIVKWMNNSTAIWNLDPPEDKWYAIDDAEGKLHVAMRGVDSYNRVYVRTIRWPITRFDEEGLPDEPSVVLFFEEGRLIELYVFDANGNYRPIRPSELPGDLTVVPVQYVDSFYASHKIPVSTPFTLNAENYDSINLVYTDVDNIPDIEDTDGDGSKLTRQFVIKDIYDSEYDITDIIENKSGELTDIGLARVVPALYTGEELVPQMEYQGELLTEGTDYSWEKVTSDQALTEAGNYLLRFNGLGRFTGGAWKTFVIVPKDDAPAKTVAEAQSKVEAAQAAVEYALANGASDIDIIYAYDNLMEAQRALAAAQEILQKIKEKEQEELSGQVSGLEKQVGELESEISDLETKVTDLNGKLAEVSVVDISNYEASLKKTSYQYTGKAIKPSVKVSGLTAEDYTVTYKNNKKIGTAQVIIKGNAARNFKGTITKTFKITKKTNTLKVKGRTASVKYKALKKKTQTIAASKAYAFTNKGKGKLTYAKLSGNKKITVNKKTGKITVKKGLKKGTYKIKVRVKAAGGSYYKAGSRTVTVRVKVG